MAGDEDWEQYKKKIVEPLMSVPEYVVSVVDKLGIESEEFKDLIRLYGKLKLRELYKNGKGAK